MKKLAYLFPDWMTQKYLRRILDYNPKTGIFRWRFDPDKSQSWNTRWVGKIAGHDSHGYVVIRIWNVFYAAHRLAFFMMTGEQPIEVDHENLKRDDNRFKNLRAANESTNQHNRTLSKNNTTGFKGVSMSEGRFKARIGVNNKVIRLGSFDTAELAAAAYERAAKKYHGEFARV